MKLNFWQILGLILVLVAGAYIAHREWKARSTPPATQGG